MIPTIKNIKEEVNKINVSITPDSILIFNPDKDDALETNYTLIYFPIGGILDILVKQIEAFKEIDANHYYYKKEKLHITLIGGINIEIDLKTLIQTIKNLLSKYKIGFKFDGTGYMINSPYFVAYPSFPLYDLRRDIKKVTEGSGKEYTDVYRYLGWINFARFLKKPKGELLKAIKDKQDKVFGTCNIGRLLLLRNTSRTLKDGKFKVVYDFGEI